MKFVKSVQDSLSWFNTKTKYLFFGGLLIGAPLLSFADIQQAQNLAQVADNVSFTASHFVTMIVWAIGLTGVICLCAGLWKLLAKGKRPDITWSSVSIPIVAGILCLSIFIVVQVISGSLFGRSSNMNQAEVTQGAQIFQNQ